MAKYNTEINLASHMGVAENNMTVNQLVGTDRNCSIDTVGLHGRAVLHM